VGIVIQMAVVVGSGVVDDKHITCAWRRLLSTGERWTGFALICYDL